jgi:hypothetical protein
MSTLNVIWNKFTGPPPSIQDTERHRQARLLSSLLLALIVVSTLSVIADVITGQLTFQTFGDYMPVIGVVATVSKPCLVYKRAWLRLCKVWESN